MNDGNPKSLRVHYSLVIASFQQYFDHASLFLGYCTIKYRQFIYSFDVVWGDLGWDVRLVPLLLLRK